MAPHASRRSVARPTSRPTSRPATRPTSRSASRLRWVALAVATLVPLGALSGCGEASQAASSNGVTTIRYQTGAGSVDPIQLADALGYFTHIKLDKVGDVTGGPASLQALASQQIDIGASAFFGAVAQTVASGVPIKAVVPTYGSNDKVSSAVVTLDGSSITSAQDLVGKKIAVNTLGANAEAVLDTWFDQQGLSESEIKKVTLVPLPPLNTAQALKEGQVDAAYLSVGAITAAQKTMKLASLVKDTDVVGPYSGGGFTLRDDFIKKNHAAATELVTGVAKAVNYIETHDKQQVFDVLFPWLEKHGYADYETAITANFPGSLGVPSATPTITDKDISIWLDWLKGRDVPGVKDLKPSEVYTNEFNPYA